MIKFLSTWILNDPFRTAALICAIQKLLTVVSFIACSHRRRFFKFQLGLSEISFENNLHTFNIHVEISFEFLCVTSLSVCKAPFENLLESRLYWLARHTIFCSAALCKRCKKKELCQLLPPLRRRGALALVALVAIHLHTKYCEHAVSQICI